MSAPDVPIHIVEGGTANLPSVPKGRRATWLSAILLPAVLLATAPAWPQAASPFGAPAAVAAPAWAGEFRWSMRAAGQAEAFHLRLGFTALPSGDWSATGSLLLDDAELGATGSARLRGGRLLVDLVVSGSVRDVPPDEGKRALYPPGRAPARISSAGFATVRIELDPRRLDGVASMYMTNVVDGNLVQGPVYAESRLVPEGR